MPEFQEYTFFNNKDMNVLIDKFIPQHIRMNYPKFVEFIKVYYQQLSEAPQSFEFLSNILAYNNIDETSMDFLENFTNQFLKGLKFNGDINQQILVKYIKEYYQAAGSEKSFKFLFRVLYNEDVSFYYPTYDILRVSDGKWQLDRVIKTTNFRGTDDILDLEGTEIVGQGSGARALVERVNLTQTSRDNTVCEMYLTEIDPAHPISSFYPEEYIIGKGLFDKEDFREMIFYILTGVEVLDEGAHYSRGDRVLVGHSEGHDAYAIVDKVSKGNIADLEVLYGGQGYAVDELITFETAFGTGARGRVSAVDDIGGKVGVITEVELVHEGFDYKRMPIPIIGEVGAHLADPAIIYPIANGIGNIETVKILNFGLDYDPNALPIGMSGPEGTEPGGDPYNPTQPDPWPQGEYTPTTFPVPLLNSEIEMMYIAYVWNTNDGPNLITNEAIVSENTDAVGRVGRYDPLTGVLGIRFASGVPFQEGDIIRGLTSGSVENIIHKIWIGTGVGQTGTVGEYDGYFRNRDGHISSDKFIQDSYYYQDFSYVLTTLRKRDEWIDVVKDKIHPAGSIVFSFGDGNEILHDPSYGGWISPIRNMVELDKFTWNEKQWSHGSIASMANTPIERYMPFRLWDNIWLEPGRYPTPTLDGVPQNQLHKTLFCYGSEIEVIPV